VGRFERTEMGGTNEVFETTHWTEIFGARTLNETQRRARLDHLLARYWKPVYCYLRRKGKDNETAKDLTQGFFQDVVLGRDLIQRAESSKGRFRTFLLTALDHYVASAYRAGMARKRRPEDGLVSLDRLGAPNLPEPSPSATPEEAFHQAWASALLDAVLNEIEAECRATGKDKHWAVFHARVVGPIMDSAEPVPLPELCARHGIESEMTASNMIVTVKRHFQNVLRRHVRQFVDSEDDIDQEISELIGLLSK
jgi:DNA-directed RNA polymerase specialized sigma24 family protein